MVKCLITSLQASKNDREEGNIFSIMDYLFKRSMLKNQVPNYTNPGYGFSLVDTLWNAGSYRQPLEQEGNPLTSIEKFWLQISLIVTKKS